MKKLLAAYKSTYRKISLPYLFRATARENVIVAKQARFGNSPDWL